MCVLDVLAKLASIITALAAAYAYIVYRRTLHRRTRAIEDALAKKTEPNDDSLTREQLAAVLGVTQEQVVEAASRRNKVQPWTGQSGEEYRFRFKRTSR